MNDELKCDVCSKIAIGVCNALGPISCAFCDECLESQRVPYWNLVGYLFMLHFTKVEDLAEWTHGVIHETLKYYNKTFDEFVVDCKEASEKMFKELDMRHSSDTTGD